METAKEIAAYAVKSPSHFKELVDIVAGEDQDIAVKAAWALGKAGEARPAWMTENLPIFLDLLVHKNHPAIARNVYRALQFTEIPSRYQALMFDLTIQELNNPKTAIAVKVFSMTVAHHITEHHAELKEELRLSIEENLSYGSAGFKNRAHKILAKL